MIFLLLIILFPFQFFEYKALDGALDIGLGIQPSDDRCVRSDIHFKVITDCMVPVVLCLGPDLRPGGNAEIIHLLILSGSAVLLQKRCLVSAGALKNTVPTYIGRYCSPMHTGIRSTLKDTA